MKLPPVYAILDAETCARRGLDLITVALAWRDAGITLMQYRDKLGSDTDVLTNAQRLREVFSGVDATLILNDRVHLFRQSGFDGVHVGQGDTSPAEVRRLIGPDSVLGLSTHSAEQVAQADLEDVSYIAIGPVYATGTKLDAEPVVGLEGVGAARPLTRKPLVAIGGIRAENAAEVRAAGADAVAVIGGLLDGDPGECASAFLRALRE